MTEHMVATQTISEAQLDWLVASGTPLRRVSFAPSVLDSALVTLSSAVSLQQHTLTVLDVARCKHLSASALMSLSKECRSLTTLCLDFCQLDDECLISFARVSGDSGSRVPPAGLSSLSLRSCQHITDAAVETVAQLCPSLTSLDLSHCRHIGDASMKALAQYCPIMSTLRLCHCDLTDNGIIPLAHGCPALTSLDLRFCSQVSDASVLSLSKLSPTIRYLNLSHCSRITAASVISMAQKCPSLTHLDLSACPNVSDVSLRALSQARLPLTSLILNSCLVSDKGVAALAEGCPALTSLDVSCCENVTDAGIFTLSQGLRSLRHLNPRHCRGVSAKGVKACCLSFSYLEYSTVTIQSKVRRKQARKRVEEIRSHDLHCREVERGRHVMELEEKVALTGTVVAAHATEMEALEEVVRQLQAKNEEQGQRLLHLEQQVTESQAMRRQEERAARVTLVAKDQEINALTASLARVRSEMEIICVENSNEIKSLVAINKALEVRVVESESQLSRCQADLEASRKTADEWQKKSSANAASKKSKEADNLILKGEVSDAKDVLLLRVKDLAEARKETASLRREVQTLRGSMTEEALAKDKVINDLRKEIELLEEIRVETQVDLEASEEQNEDLQEEVSSLTLNFRKKESELFWKTKEYDTVIADKDAMSAKWMATDKRNKALEDDIAQQMQATADITADLIACQVELSHLREENASLENKNIEINDCFLDALGVGKKSAAAKKSSQTLLSEIENERNSKMQNAIDSSSSSGVAATEENKGTLKLRTSTARSQADQEEEKSFSDALRADQLAGEETKMEAEREITKDEDKSVASGVEQACHQSSPPPSAENNPVKKSSKLKEQYLKHLQSLKGEGASITTSPKREVSKLWTTSPKASARGLNSSSEVDPKADTTMTLAEMSMSSPGVDGMTGAGRKGGPELVLPVPPCGVSSVDDLHEPEMSVHSSSSTPRARVGAALYIPTGDDEEEDESEWSFSVQSQSEPLESPPPPPPALSSMSPPSLSFSFSSRPSPSSVFSGSEGLSRGSSKTHKSSPSFIRLTSSQKLRVLGDAESKDHFKGDQLHHYVFNKEDSPEHSPTSRSRKEGYARSPSQAIKHKFLETQRGVANMSGPLPPQVAPGSPGSSGSPSAKVYKNSSRGVTSVLAAERGGGGRGGGVGSSPPKPLAKMLTSTSRKNNIF